MTATNTTLPLSQLRIDDKANVRKIGRDIDPVLVASIKSVGLLQPLRVRANGKGYVVHAGGQRLLALQEIAKEAKTPDMPVPVVITEESDALAREASLHENVARKAMHPVDEYKSFAKLKEDGQTVEQIAQRFAIDAKQVQQRLALGDLDETVLNAWQVGEIDARAVKLFTMAPTKKAQKAALEKARAGHLNHFNIRDALGLTGDHRMGKLLSLVTEDAYRARGGSVARDLFAEGNQDNTSVSDPALLTAMGEELLDAEVARLQAEGWGTVSKEKPQTLWNYPRIEATPKPTKEETKRLKEIEKIFEAAEQADEYLENNDELESEKEAIQQAIEARALASIDAKVKAKSLAFVTLDHDWSRIEITFRANPKPEAAAKDAKSESKKEQPAEDTISHALLDRQAEQLTAAAQDAVKHEPKVAAAILIAALASNDDAVTITSRATMGKRTSFETSLASALKMTPAQQLEALTSLVAPNIKLTAMRKPVLESNSANKAIAHAINPKAMVAAIRTKWDAKDYFASVSRAVIVEAVREAMGDDHARTVEKMGKADAATFATSNLPKLKWLPKQIRVPGYDGPSKKAAPAKKAPAKAVAKKAKR